MENLQIDLAVRGDYKSADLYLVPRAVQYAELIGKALRAFDEETVEVVIERTSMPFPYYEALEIPLDVFAEKYGVKEGDQIDIQDAISLCKDLLEVGLFDIGFEGEKISVFLSHDGYVNIKPRDIDKNTFRDTIESLGVTDEA